MTLLMLLVIALAVVVILNLPALHGDGQFNEMGD